MIDLEPGILPTRTRMNPSQPETAEFYHCEQTAYIVRVDGLALRLITSHGSVGKGWEIGTAHDMRHDQTGAKLGVAEVVGIRSFKTGKSSGEVPDRAIPHYVFK